MYDLRNLREMLCKELDEISDKREMSAGDLDAIQKLTSSIKNTTRSRWLKTAAIPAMASGRRICAVLTAGASLTVAAAVTQWAAIPALMPASICARSWTI